MCIECTSMKWVACFACRFILDEMLINCRDVFRCACHSNVSTWIASAVPRVPTTVAHMEWVSLHCYLVVAIHSCWSGIPEVREPIVSVGPQPWGQGPPDADASEYSMPFACNKQLSSVILHRCCHLIVYNPSCSVPLPVNFYEVGGTGTLFANNHRCRNAVACVPRHVIYFFI